MPLSPEQLEWADIIFVMQKAHRNKLQQRFRHHLGGKRVTCLDIRMNTTSWTPSLLKLLEARGGLHLRYTSKAGQSAGL